MGIMPWDGIVGLAGDVITRIWPDKTEQEKAKAALAQAELAGRLKELEAGWNNALAQIEVNKVEAQNPNWFIAGGRPAVIWIGAAGLAYDVLFQPLLTWLSAIAHIPVPPVIDQSLLMPLLMGLLGLGGMRTFEKLKGVNGSHG